MEPAPAAGGGGGGGGGGAEEQQQQQQQRMVHPVPPPGPPPPTAQVVRGPHASSPQVLPNARQGGLPSGFSSSPAPQPPPGVPPSLSQQAPFKPAPPPSLPPSYSSLPLSPGIPAGYQQTPMAQPPSSLPPSQKQQIVQQPIQSAPAPPLSSPGSSGRTSSANSSTEQRHMTVSADSSSIKRALEEVAFPLCHKLPARQMQDTEKKLRMLESSVTAGALRESIMTKLSSLLEGLANQDRAKAETCQRELANDFFDSNEGVPPWIQGTSRLVLLLGNVSSKPSTAATATATTAASPSVTSPSPSAFQEAPSGSLAVHGEMAREETFQPRMEEVRKEPERAFGGAGGVAAMWGPSTQRCQQEMWRWLEWERDLKEMKLLKPHFPHIVLYVDTNSVPVLFEQVSKMFNHRYPCAVLLMQGQAGALPSRQYPCMTVHAPAALQERVETFSSSSGVISLEEVVAFVARSTSAMTSRKDVQPTIIRDDSVGAAEQQPCPLLFCFVEHEGQHQELFSLLSAAFSTEIALYVISPSSRRLQAAYKVEQLPSMLLLEPRLLTVSEKFHGPIDFHALCSWLVGLIRTRREASSTASSHPPPAVQDAVPPQPSDDSLKAQESALRKRAIPSSKEEQQPKVVAPVTRSRQQKGRSSCLRISLLLLLPLLLLPVVWLLASRLSCGHWPHESSRETSGGLGLLLKEHGLLQYEEALGEEELRYVADLVELSEERIQKLKMKPIHANKLRHLRDSLASSSSNKPTACLWAEAAGGKVQEALKAAVGAGTAESITGAATSLLRFLHLSPESQQLQRASLNMLVGAGRQASRMVSSLGSLGGSSGDAEAAGRAGEGQGRAGMTSAKKDLLRFLAMGEEEAPVGIVISFLKATIVTLKIFASPFWMVAEMLHGQLELSRAATFRLWEEHVMLL